MTQADITHLSELQYALTNAVVIKRSLQEQLNDQTQLIVKLQVELVAHYGSDVAFQ